MEQFKVFDNYIKKYWNDGKTIDEISEIAKKSPTSIAAKLIRLGIFLNREEAIKKNNERGGACSIKLESDSMYTIYLIRNPKTKEPVYVGQTQKFIHRMKTHSKNFTLIFNEEPIIEVLSEHEFYKDAIAEEKKKILFYMQQGAKLFNSNHIENAKRVKPKTVDVHPRIKRIKPENKIKDEVKNFSHISRNGSPWTDKEIKYLENNFLEWKSIKNMESIQEFLEATAKVHKRTARSIYLKLEKMKFIG